MAVALSCLAAMSAWWQWADALDKIAYDQFLQFRPKDPPADVIVVAIDEYSLSHIGEWPWSRKHHAELINHLTDAGASAIGFDVVFAELNPLDPEGDEAFAAAIIGSGKVVLPIYIDRTQLGGQLIEVLPHPAFAEHAKMGHVN
ncbi:MAG: CHASE2 domain-containing protein, partial [Pseudomonadales bacterium]|nr:CHASE2 domain-containing protein [Pseudomonadales bacterium]